ncbi:PIG-L family deacetylase [Nitrososphaera sp.]|uniref:PIG-L deacetylase family protein n=1 Tax=Nitrososphaera sp. TaxID=1971748 RepID=UPI00316CE0EB
MNILAVGAHFDDIELGCGGTMARFRKEGHSTYGIILTDSVVDDDELQIKRSYETAIEENRKAAKKIGIEMLSIEKPVIQGFLNYSTDIMRMLEKVIYSHKIDTMFTHWAHDLNTDHAAAGRISITAARHIPRIAMYRSNWYQVDKPFNENLFVDITDFASLKREALHCYADEVKSRGTEWIESFHHQNAQTGFKALHRKVGRELFAESFEIVKWTI